MLWQSEANREGGNCGYFNVDGYEQFYALCTPDAFYVCFGYEPEEVVVAEAEEQVADAVVADEVVADVVDNAIENAVEAAVDAIVSAV